MSVTPDMAGIAGRLLERHRERGELELLSDFGLPFSTALISHLLGIPEEDEPFLKKCSESFFYLFVPMPSEEIRAQVDRSLEEFRYYFAALIKQRRASPGSDLISELLQTTDRGRRLSEAELIDTCMLLFADGVENIDSGLGSAIIALLDHPDQLQLLRERPELMLGAANELLRYETPAQFLGRVACEDTSIGGVPIRKHQAVLLMIGAANRDPEQFDRPDRLNILRSPNPHLVFGRGKHSCIGTTFASTQFGAGLAAILHHLPDIALKNETRRWIPRLGHRWLAELPVTFSPH